MEPTGLLRDPRFRRAVAAIQLRAEKQTEWDKLEQVFVRSDLLDRVESPDSQLVLGRRGTGKTHLLRVFAKDALSHGESALYIDLTQLGSGYSGLDIAPRVVAQKYFIAFLNQLGSELLELVASMELAEISRQDEVFGTLTHGFTPIPEPQRDGHSATFDYRTIAASIEGVLSKVGVKRLYIILDEWALVPFEAQPYLGEYLKRAVLSVPQISAKILAVNYQCQFAKRVGSDLIGLERGADIPNVIDMDRYLVFDEKRDYVPMFFGQVLYNHVGVALSWEMELSAAEKLTHVQRLFTHAKAFEELVRAAEGNCRDFLCIFTRAFFDEFRQSTESKSISIPNVVKAAISWFDQEKAANVYAEEAARETLAFLMERVLKGYKARTFLVESTKAEHPRLVRLLNERVLHRLSGTYHHPDRPGIRHDLFTVDYGAFVRLRGTINEIREEVFWEMDDPDRLTPSDRNLMVPVDDKRSIRRITFDPDTVSVTGYRPEIREDSPQQRKLFVDSE